jgi:hypothetical protein
MRYGYLTYSAERTSGDGKTPTSPMVLRITRQQSAIDLGAASRAGLVTRINAQ